MELSQANIVKQGANYHVQYGDDNGLYVEFDLKPIQDEERSLKEGRPIFRDVEFVTIRFVGDKNKVVSRPVKLDSDAHGPADPLRFPKQWQAFKNKTAVVHDGTPITEYPPITKSMALELKALNIHTVEALAAVSDVNLNWMGARSMRDQAKAWLEQAKSGGAVLALQKENEQLKSDLDSLKAQLSELSELLQDKEKDKPRRGRPPKEVVNGEDAA